MKILMLNRDKHLWVGGDMVQLEAISRELQKLGHEVRFSSSEEIDDDYNWCDIGHLWNLPMTWTFHQYANLAAMGKKVVISTIYNNTERFITHQVQQRILNGCDAAICLSDDEIKRMQGQLRVNLDKTHIVPNGVDEMFFADIPKTEEYVLTVGRLEEFKGQRYVAAVCKKMGLRYVCIGNGEDKELLEQLGAEVHTAMPQEDLVKWYAGCSHYILASKAEVFPLTILEAAAQGKKIILTDNSAWLPFGAILCTHGDQLSIKAALESEETGTIPVSEYLWASAAKEIERIYQECL